MKELLERIRLTWQGLNPREQRITAAGGIAAALIIFYAGIWDPISSARAQREQALSDARRMAERIATLAAAAPAAQSTAGADLSLSLLAAVDQSSKSPQLGKIPSRIQPDGDAQVRVWFEDVPFNNLVRWLAELQTRYGVRVDSMDIERESGPGLVNARLALVRS